jgi:deoxyribonuclease-1
MIFSRLLCATLATLSLTACASAPAMYPLQPAANSQFSARRAPLQVFNSRFARLNTGDWYQNLSPEQQQYYAPAQGKRGQDLFLSLNQVIQQNQWVPSYGGARSFMYGRADNIQMNGTTGILDAYSYAFIAGKGDNGNRYREQGDTNRDGQSGDFINCEHTWPQSFFGKKMPMKADMHHLFPTLSKPNSMRNNHPIGMATGVTVYETGGGAKLGVIDKSGRHNPEEIRRWYNLPWNQQPHDIMRRDLQATFEPPAEHKGNTARAMLYFYLRYYDQDIRRGAFEEDVYWDSKVRTYIEWAKADPVDEQERRRHDMIAQKQKNRNPFVDIPNLAEVIGEHVFINDPQR